MTNEKIDLPKNPDAELGVDVAKNPVSPAEAVETVNKGVSGVRRSLRGALDSRKPASLAEDLSRKFGDVADVTPLQLPGPEFEGKEVFEISVADLKKWAYVRNLRKLVPAFGETLFEAYKDRDDKTKYDEGDKAFMDKFFENDMNGTDLSISKEIIVVAEGGKVKGFIGFRDYPLEGRGDVKAGSVTLVAVHPDLRKGGLAKKLYEVGFNQSGYDAIVGLSHTPSAMKLRIFPEDSGWKFYYAGAKNGDQSLPLSESERKLLGFFGSALKKENAEDPDIGKFQAGIPDNYISYGDLGIPPRKPKEVDVEKGGPLARTILKLVNWQRKNRPEDCIYGMAISVKDSALEKFK